MKQIIVLLILLQSTQSYCLSEELRILCWEGYAPEEHIEKFELFIKNKYDVNLNVKVTYASEIHEFFDQIRGQKTDLISPAHNLPKSKKWNFISGNVVLPLNLDNIPNYKNIIPSLKKADYITDNGKIYGAPIVYGIYGLAYNTHFFEQAPTSWDILWNKKYAGNYAISSDYYEANIYITALTELPNNDALFDYEQLKNNKMVHKKLKQLAENSSRFWKGIDKVDDLKGLAIATAWGFSFTELNKQGEQWKFARPKEGTTGWIDNWLIGYSLKNKPQMKLIAEEWINYSLSPEMQIDYLRNINQFPVNLSITPSLTAQEIKNYHLNEPQYIENNILFWKPLSRRHRNGFKLMWKKATKGLKKH